MIALKSMYLLSDNNLNQSINTFAFSPRIAYELLKEPMTSTSANNFTETVRCFNSIDLDD